jgi:hypothetical protein
LTSTPTACTPTPRLTATALAQQHFGAGFDARHLPGNWTSTENATEELLFLAKDMLVVVDDFAPQGAASDVARLHRAADRVFRNAGNRSARQRMRSDGTLRAPRPPRCLLLATGEDMPRGHSVRARLVAVEMSKDDITSAKLAAAQADAAAGKYALAMAGYLRWLAGRYDTVGKDVADALAQTRGAGQKDARHMRTPANLAHLLLGWEYFLRFAVEVGAVSEDERQNLLARVRAALEEIGRAQARHHEDADAAAMFLRLLRAAIVSGRAHVASKSGEEPLLPESWGWRRAEVGSGEHARTVWQSQGDCVGWLDGDDLYLDPESAHAAAQRLATAKGEALPLTSSTLGKRLKEKGLLVTTDAKRESLKVRRTLQGRRQDVWNLRSRGFFSTEKPDQPDQGDDSVSQAVVEEEVASPVPGSGFSERAENPTPEPDHSGEKPDQWSECGRVSGGNPTSENNGGDLENAACGRVGRVSVGGESAPKENNRGDAWESPSRSPYTDNY